MADIKGLFWKFVKFGLVGFSGMAVDYGFLVLFVKVCGWPDLVANACSFTLAATSNYFLNRIWTFRSHEKQVGVEYLKFILVSLIGLGINNGTLWLGGKLLPAWNDDWRFYILWVFAVGVTTLWNFFGNLLFTFKRK